MNPARSHPQLTADELQQLRWLLGGVLGLLALSTVFTMEVGAAGVAVFTTVAIAAATVRPDWLAWVPRWVHRLAFSVVAAFFTADLWITGELLPAIVRLDALLLFYRAITYRKKRDDLQLIVLGLFLVVLGGVLSVSLVFVLQILAFTAVALAMLVTITLAENTAGASRPALVLASADGTAGAGAGGPQPPAWARHVPWRRLLRRVRQVTDWRIVAFSGALFVGLVGLAAVLFLAIPRFQLESGFFLERFITKKTRTGFSDTIRFGEVTEITQDNSVALTVDVSDRREIPAEPYWRMLVLDEYRDGTFRLSAALRRLVLRQERGGVTLRGAASSRDGEPGYWTFYLESGVSRYLPLLGRFELLRFREPQNYRFSQNLGVVELRGEPATMLAYRVEGMEQSLLIADGRLAADRRAAEERRWSAEALWLQLGVSPEDRVVLQRLVAEIAERAAVSPATATRAARAEGEAAANSDRREPDAAAPSGNGFRSDVRITNIRGEREQDDGAVEPRGGFRSDVRNTNIAGEEREDGEGGQEGRGAAEFLRRAEAWLERRHGYTLSPRIPAGPGDPLVRWMQSTEAGHCELFAGSLVLLARAAGLPARVVTGFRGGSWNGYSNNFTLRNSDAHAWCEVFDPAVGAWRRSDPTPGSAAAARNQDRGEEGLASRIDRSWTARLDSLRVFWYRRIVNFDQQSQIETLQAVKEATERSGRELRERVARWVAELRGWLARPWSGGRMVKFAATMTAAVAAAWIVATAAIGWLRARRRRRGRNGDPVRIAAGRWLTRFETVPVGEEHAVLVAALQRLRFGASATWVEPRQVLRDARQAWRDAGRRRAESPRYRTNADER